MTTDTYIQENKTETFKKGDTVVMHSCAEADLPKYKEKKWICLTDSYLDRAKQEVVFLEGFSGCFFAQFLQKLPISVTISDEKLGLSNEAIEIPNVINECNHEKIQLKSSGIWKCKCGYTHY